MCLGDRIISKKSKILKMSDFGTFSSSFLVIFFSLDLYLWTEFFISSHILPQSHHTSSLLTRARNTPSKVLYCRPPLNKTYDNQQKKHNNKHNLMH